jgi:hypothetical protein
MKAKKKRPTNTIGIVFECGCQVPYSGNGKIYHDPNNNRIVCQKHGARIRAKIYFCRECGEIFERNTKSAAYCEECQKENLAASIARSTANKRDRDDCEDGRNKKEDFDQEKRELCRFGDYCMNKECFLNEVFNCFNCPRFDPVVKFDILDYASTGYSFEVPA